MFNENIRIGVIYHDDKAGRKAIESSMKQLAKQIEETQKTISGTPASMAAETGMSKQLKDQQDSYASLQSQLGQVGEKRKEQTKQIIYNAGKGRDLVKITYDINKVNDKYVVGSAKMETSTRRFRMEMLSVMFFGMQLQRTFGGIVDQALEIAGVTDLFNVAFQDVMLTALEPFLDTLYDVGEGVMDMPDWAKSLAGMAIFGASAFGGLLMSLGQLVLFMDALKDIGGLTGLISEVKGIATSLTDIVGREWKTVVKFAKEGWKDITDAFDSLVKWASESSVWKAVVKFAEEGYTYVKGLWDSIPSEVQVMIQFGVGLVIGEATKQLLQALYGAADALGLPSDMKTAIGAILTAAGITLALAVGGPAAAAGVAVVTVPALVNQIQETINQIEQSGAQYPGTPQYLLPSVPTGGLAVMAPELATGSLTTSGVVGGYTPPTYPTIQTPTIPTTWVPGTQDTPGAVYSGWYGGWGTFQDFISRPGMGIQAISPNDTVIGVQDTDMLGGNYEINISINNPSISSDYDLDELARKLGSRFYNELQRIRGGMI